MHIRQPDDILYNFESDRKLRTASIGAGGHAFRIV